MNTTACSQCLHDGYHQVWSAPASSSPLHNACYGPYYGCQLPPENPPVDQHKWQNAGCVNLLMPYSYSSPWSV